MFNKLTLGNARYYLIVGNIITYFEKPYKELTNVSNTF